MTDAEHPPLSDLVARAIADHLAPNGGGILTGFHLIAEYVDLDGDTCWTYAVAADQDQPKTIGLIEWARGVARYEQRRYLEVLPDD